MATLPRIPIASNTPISNRYSDNYTIRKSKQPSGPCNYTNLNIGGNPKCGCLRFTNRTLERHGYLDASPGLQGLCVCEHHSCFHSHSPVDADRNVGDVYMSDRSAMTPRQSAGPLAYSHTREDMQIESEVGQPSRENPMPDTLRWSGFIKSGSSQGSLPAIPSQCLLPSENGSRASSSQNGYALPFQGRGMDTLSHIKRPSSGVQPSVLSERDRIMGENGKLMQIYHDSNGHRHLQSVTEVATPSMQSSQDLDAEIAFTKNAADIQESLTRLADGVSSANVTMTLRPSGDASVDGRPSITVQNERNGVDLLPKIRSLMHHVADYPMTIRNHEHRLDQLENNSFSNAPIENLRDEHELLDTRMMELEGRMESVEKQQLAHDTSSIGSHALANASMDSTSSSALIAAAIDHLDYSRIEALESQILELQAVAPPSYARPWEVEVVFLPFGPQLMGIWSSQLSMTQRSRMNSGSGDEWTQTQQHSSMAVAQARLTSHDHPVAWETSTSSNKDEPWLMPRACGLQSRIDERLRSRGLVRTIQIKGSDARDVQAAMLSAFGDLPGVLADDPYTDNDEKCTIPRKLRHYLGLHSPWIPLRKVHKNSCLRFLNTSEMLTPALWTVQFLASSVAMRSAGIRRLYVTQPDSYIQNLAPTASWTWQKLRQLDRVYPDTNITNTPERDAEEPCWAFDDRFDTAPSTSSSISSHHSLSIRSLANDEPEPTSPSDHFSSAGVSPALSTSPTSLPPHGPPSSPQKERHPFRLLHTRTISMPSLIPLKSSPSQPSKRRITSFDREAEIHSSPTRASAKRYRTRSPSRPRDTPRWSVGPPSPYAFVEETEKSRRGMTPFAYATPHSNAPYVEPRVNRDGVEEEERGTTTDDDEEIGGEGRALSDYEEEQWEGVQEEEMVAGPDGEESDENSCPSEYPSKQVEAVGSTKAGFRIHVDEEVA
jgi:hypothetical protein